MRKGGRVRRRVNVYLEVEVAAALAAHCADAGAELSFVVNRAVKAWLAKERR